MNKSAWKFIIYRLRKWIISDIILVCIIVAISFSGCVGSVNKYSGTHSINETTTIGNIKVTMTRAVYDNGSMEVAFNIKANRELDLNDDTYFVGYCDNVKLDIAEYCVEYTDGAHKNIEYIVLYGLPESWNKLEVDYSPKDYYGGSNLLKFVVNNSN